MNTKSTLLVTLLILSFTAEFEVGADQPTGKTQLRVTPNRTLPNFEPPKTNLEFSVQPTVQEIFHARVFAEPLVPVGGEPTLTENADLAAALLGYAKRTGPDDFASLTGFLDKHASSPWRAALLTCLGLEYYNTAHYSRAVAAWEEAWPLAKDANDLKGKAIADRAVGELAGMYARLGRMTVLEALLKSVEGRTFVGAATEKMTAARESLWRMQNKPETSFKCGPYALLQILKSHQSLHTSALTSAGTEIANAASTQKGLSLPQVAELSKKVGLNYQMAFRDSSHSALRTPRSAFVVSSVVHWKVGHYAALVRQEGDRFLLEDPTFGISVWATRQALEAETSGYCLIPPGDLPRGWRSVDPKEGAGIWGKGVPGGSAPGGTGPCDDTSDSDTIQLKPFPSDSCSGSGCGSFGGGPPPGSGGGGGGPPPGANGGGGGLPEDENGVLILKNPFAGGMAVSRAHLMLVSLNIVDTPVGYAPPVGPAVPFTVRYGQRDAFQPANFTYSNFGPKWTCDWISYITDNPSNTLADVNYYVMGGGTRTFTGFNSGSQTYAYQQYDQTQLRRTGPASYEMFARDGSKLVFNQSDGSIGSSRKIFLTQFLDPFGNSITLTYDGSLRIVAISDAIGQVTTLTYGNTNDLYKITRVTDPFGRFADFAYDALGRLTNITDVIGLNSRFVYSGSADFISQLITPYGTNTFIAAQGGGPHGTTRSLETVYPDGSRERVEYNQSVIPGIPTNDPPAIVPTGMPVNNQYLQGRNTYYWSRTACASGYGDYTKAKVYHWLHTENIDLTAGVLESTKEALENRVWYNYAGQNVFPGGIGTSSRPTKIGRVLEDGSTQLHAYAYNGFGHVTNSVDPVGRTFSYLYAANGIDLLEIRQTRAGNNELLFRATYNAQHLPLTKVGADGQTNSFTYNARGQVLTATNPKGETKSYTYDTNGYLVAVDGPLPGTNDVVRATYDAFGRTESKTDASGYTLAFEYDNLDRPTKITHPDSTFAQLIYNRLDMVALRDRAGRQTLFEYDNTRQMRRVRDPLGRVTLFDWCRCGQIKSLTDPLGRTTSWLTDVQGRVTAKQYGDGSEIRFVYENASSRLNHVIDEKGQITQFTWNLDDTLKAVACANIVVSTPTVSYLYDPNYRRRISMTDGIGTTLYSYYPITGVPTLGAGSLAGIDGPLPNDTITYAYDELGRRVFRAINGVAAMMTYDAAGRVVTHSNALGAFTYAYDANSHRIVAVTLPNGQTEERSYGNVQQDLTLQRITHKRGTTPISEFLYGHDIAENRITTWSQQAGAATPSVFSFEYDNADQLLSATVTNAGILVSTFAYAYDLAANRLTEQLGSSNYIATYNALNQINTTTAPGASRTNEWDAKNQLVAVNNGNERTESAYDGLGRLASLRKLLNGSEVSFRRFVWCDNELCEERDAGGAVTKRFFPHGMRIETGPSAGSYFYTRDHLGSVRELTDTAGNVRARYTYDPFGRRTKLSGDLEADLGFTGLLFANETGVLIARFRAYDPDLGRWLSRDPWQNAEAQEGPNLYAYVQNDPVNFVDRLGLNRCCAVEHVIGANIWAEKREECDKAIAEWKDICNGTKRVGDGSLSAPPPYIAQMQCEEALKKAHKICSAAKKEAWDAYDEYLRCLKKPCPPICKP